MVKLLELIGPGPGWAWSMSKQRQHSDNGYVNATLTK